MESPFILSFFRSIAKPSIHFGNGEMLISNQHNQCKHDEGKCNVYERETSSDSESSDSEDSQDGDKENIETDKNQTPLLENESL